MATRSKMMTIVCFLVLWYAAAAQTDAGDLKVLKAFLQGLSNPGKLRWTGNDPCGQNQWQGIKCSGIFVSSIDVAGLNLGGMIAFHLNQLKSLTTLSLQGNSFSGSLPNLTGLTKLQAVYLNDNNFDTIPTIFFANLTALQYISLTNNRLNISTGGWFLSTDLQSSPLLTNLSLTNTSLIGAIPNFLGKMTNLEVLEVAYNRLGGGIPQSFSASNLLHFQANNQFGPQLSGTIEAVAGMQSLSLLWLHENNLSGTIPQSLGNAVSLTDLRLNGNRFVGPIPRSFLALPLVVFALENNGLDGPIPLFNRNVTFTYENNYFCQNTPGASCAPPVTALLAFLGTVNYPSSIVESWKGNNPCISWIGITCDSNGNISVINLANSHLSGTISPALAQLSSLSVLKLDGNNFTGIVPNELASLQNLTILDVSNNNLTGPIPKFSSHVTLNTTGNRFINTALPPSSSPTGNSVPGLHSARKTGRKAKSISLRVAGIIGIVASAVAILALACLLFYKKYPENYQRCRRFRKLRRQDSFTEKSTTPRRFGTMDRSLAISLAVLQKATNNFADENMLAKGGFGSVYKGELADGTKVAVKRMEATKITSKGLKEFQAEIDALTKVRHRHLVELLGYCIEDSEKLLVYEFMPQGSLSQHLFDRQNSGLRPLSWTSRLIIALDVARGLEYLHGLAHTSFIHRDMKSANILLDDNFRAKVADFGLVKLVPDGGKHSVETMLAGTFGYVAPEYAVTGRITTKADVFSFGVVLMEIITGRKTLDESQTEDKYQLVSWFTHSTGDKDALLKAVDPVVAVTDDSFRSICVVADLAKHCTYRNPHKRPDMRHAVNVLAGLIEEWKPTDADEEESELTYDQACKQWHFMVDSSFTYETTQKHLRPATVGEASTSDGNKYNLP